jgi:hypothetical protein
MLRQFEDGTNYVVVLERGDKLIASLTEFASQNNLDSLWLQSGLGSAVDTTLGWYDIETKSYNWQNFEEAYEITSLQGNLTTVDNEPFWHIHGVFGGPHLEAIAGHVKELTVGLTCELFISRLATPMSRSYDEPTGLQLIK